MSETTIEDTIAITPLTSPPDATVTVPGSKSFTNRALLIAALARGRSVLTGALRSDDTRHMAGALRALGVVLGTLIHPGFYALSGFVGAGLIFAGVSGTCAMARLLQLAPWNRKAVA